MWATDSNSNPGGEECNRWAWFVKRGCGVTSGGPNVILPGAGYIFLRKYNY